MPRTARLAPGRMIFHVLNRGVGRMRLFLRDADFEAFERMIAQTLESRPLRILSYCLLSNHWHLLLWPQDDGDLGALMQKLTITHARHWQEHRRPVGYGHLDQGRYQSFPVESDKHFYQVARYVERNALRGGLVRRADNWRWSSLWRRLNGSATERALLSDWPLSYPKSWRQYVNPPHAVNRAASPFSLRVSGDEAASLPWRRSDVRLRPACPTAMSAGSIAWPES